MGETAIVSAGKCWVWIIPRSRGALLSEIILSVCSNSQESSILWVHLTLMQS